MATMTSEQPDAGSFPTREIGGSSMALLLDAARQMDELARQARIEAVKALEAQHDYRMMADRLRELASEESVNQEWSDWSPCRV